MKIISTFAEWINFRKLICTLYRLLSLFHQLMFYYQYLHYIIQSLFSTLIETHFDQKVPWNFLQSSMELFEQHLDNNWGSMEFHGT